MLDDLTKSRGRKFEISFIEIGHEIISKAILSLSLSDSNRALVSY